MKRKYTPSLDLISAFVELLPDYRPGDKFRVLRKANDGESGWNNHWTEEMDQAIGQVLTVSENKLFPEDPSFGIPLDIIDRRTPGHDGPVISQCFPWFALEFIERRNADYDKDPHTLLLEIAELIGYKEFTTLEDLGKIDPVEAYVSIKSIIVKIREDIDLALVNVGDDAPPEEARLINVASRLASITTPPRAPEPAKPMLYIPSRTGTGWDEFDPDTQKKTRESILSAVLVDTSATGASGGDLPGWCDSQIQGRIAKENPAVEDFDPDSGKLITYSDRRFRDVSGDVLYDLAGTALLGSDRKLYLKAE
jgi:hypothetical protein